MGKKKMSKREVRQAEHTFKKRELRDMTREDRRSEMVRSAQVSVSYQCVGRMQLLRPRARTRCALVWQLPQLVCIVTWYHALAHVLGSACGHIARAIAYCLSL